jgi:hypothetical protein
VVKLKTIILRSLKLTLMFVPIVLVSVLSLKLLLYERGVERDLKLLSQREFKRIRQKHISASQAVDERLRSVSNLECFECHSVITLGESAYRITFSHMKHIRRGTHCSYCHRDIKPSQRRRPYPKHGPVPMRVCLECHDDKSAPKSCSLCHARPQTVMPGTHGLNWLERHPKETKEEIQCLQCHTKTLCDMCHKPRRPQDHTPTFIARHGEIARAREMQCLRCHDRSTCDSCHGIKEPQSHRQPDFMLRHGKLSLSGRNCLLCHSTAFCDSCHGLRMPHPRGYAQKHKEAKDKAIVCMRCHTQSWCDACHGMPMPHPKDYRRAHTKVKPEEQKLCVRCHGEKPCESCHGVPLPHPEGFALKHSDVASLKPDSVCFKCHKFEETCAVCHKR